MGINYVYEGIVILVGEIVNFIFINVNGCDFVVIVEVEVVEVLEINIVLLVCEGVSIDYNGIEL